MTGEEGGGHSGLYHTSSQVLLARLYDNVLTNLHPAGLRQKACVNCGQLADSSSSHTESSDDNAEERSEFSDSDLSSTSTDITVRLTRNFSSHNISKKSPAETRTLQYSRSLSSLPLRPGTRDHAKLTRITGQTGEIPVRQKVKFSLHPHLIYSDETGDSEQSNHQKLVRKSNVLTGLAPVIRNQEEECETLEDEEESGVEDDETDEADEASGLQRETMDYYKTMKTGENIYSYAYRDAFSPAALIKLEDCSDVSEDVYDSIKAPSEISKIDVMSDTMSDKGDLFFSISKGRRNYLKLHRHVGWDMERVKEVQEPVDLQEKKKENRNHSRLLPILMHEEKKRVIAETNAVRQKQNNQDLCYYKYKHPPQYKNVRNSKIQRMIRREVEGAMPSSNQDAGVKEKLKLKKSLQRNFSRISFFNGKKEAGFNIKVSLQRKLTSMMSYIKLF